MNQTKISLLEGLLGSFYVVLFKTQRFHWTVQGMNFYSLHAFYETLYNQLFEHIDVLAERMRALGAFPSYALQPLIAQSGCKECDAQFVLSDINMLTTLLQDYQALVSQTKTISSFCERDADLGTQDLCIDFLRQFEKTIWMLQSHIKQT